MARRRAASVVLVLALAATACAASTRAPAPPPLATPPAPATPPPTPEDPPPTTEGDVTVATLRGMQLVVKRTPGAEFVAADLCIRGGVRNWTIEKAGIEQLALEVATSGGTQSMNKEAYTRKLASLGATIAGDAYFDYSAIDAKAPKASWDALFPILVETFLAPALTPSEFEIVRRRELSERRHELENGDGRLRLLMRKVAYAGHPYERRPGGTLDTLPRLTADELAPHLAKLRETSRLVLVVVGDVDPARTIQQALAAFGSLPRGSYTDTPIPPLHFDGPHLATDTFPLPTNYIEAIFAGPSWGDPDYPAMWLGMNVLGERLWDEVRSKRNLSYAPSARFEPRATATDGALYVTAVDPNATMKVMFDEVRRIQAEPIGTKELEAAKAMFLTQRVQNHESVDGQASDLEEAVVVGGDWHAARRNLDRVRALTPEAVRDAMKKWLLGPQTILVGDPSKLDPKVVGAL